MSSKIKSASAQDAERRVVRGSTKGQASRANGAQSRGPVTPEGRAASSRNSLRHGLTSKSIVLPDESLEDYQFLLDSYLDQFAPEGGVEMELVQAMAAARWRLRRICTIETIVLDNEMVLRKEYIDEQLTSMDADDRLACVFTSLADHAQALALLVLLLATLTRS